MSLTYTSFQTLDRWLNIARINRSTNRTLWMQIEEILDALDVGAMSSDYTDEESTFERKTVTRARTPWRAPEVAHLMAVVETYPSKMKRAGNKAIPRTFDLRNTRTSERKAIPKLPVNFYDPGWFASLTTVEKDALATRKAMDIPELVPHVRSAWY